MSADKIWHIWHVPVRRLSRLGRASPNPPVGGRPILWHIMKTYAHYGHKEFILCLGYKGDMIKEYFRNYLWNTCDCTLMLGQQPMVHFHNRHDEEDWTV